MTQEEAREVAPEEEGAGLVDLDAARSDGGLDEVLLELDRELTGLAPVKARVREIASLLLVARLREAAGVPTRRPSLHMSFTGSPGTGKTTVARRMATLLHRLGYLKTGHLVAVSRDDLVGQYVGHTGPRTREAVKKARGGVLFIDEAYGLHRPENERDYGIEAIEVLLQAMEDQRDELVVILAGYEDRMAGFFQSNPGFHSRVAHHIPFPDFGEEELLAIAEGMLEERGYHFDDGAREAFVEYLALRRTRPHFANARSVRNALDRAILRQAGRLVKAGGRIASSELLRLDAADIRASRVFDHAAPSPP